MQTIWGFVICYVNCVTYYSRPYVLKDLKVQSNY